MNMLVTGGAGFVGANFIYYQLEKHPEDRIICLDKLTYAGNLKTLDRAMARENFRFARGDIADAACVDALFAEEKPDIVVNFAAESHVDRSIKDPDLFLRTNVLGTQVLMDACLKHGVGRFHHVSSDEVYGDLPLDRPDLLFTESTPLRPSSPYAATKAAADMIAQAFYRTYGLPVTITRGSNNYGPYQFPEKLIPLMIVRALNGQKLPVYGKGVNVRDWLYVSDHCIATDLVARKGRPGEVYNVGGSFERSTLQVVKAILKELGKSDSLISFVADRPGHDLRYAIDSTKIWKELNWAPEVSFDEGIQMAVQWYLENRLWWEEILAGEYRDYYEQMCASLEAEGCGCPQS